MNFPILSAITFLPLVGALFVFLIKDNSNDSINNIKYVSIFVSLVNFLLAIFLWILFDYTTADFQFVENREWIKGFFNFRFGVDGISILFILLTTLLLQFVFYQL